MPTQQQKEKIFKAVEEVSKLYNILEKNLDKELFAFIYRNTYVAGGFLRDYLVDDDFNDVDIFFIDVPSASEFSFKVFDNTYFTPTENNNLTFKVKDKKLIKFSFNIFKANNPKTLTDGFDFTFNKHYVRPFDSSFSFDLDTFDRKGAALEYQEKSCFYHSLRLQNFINKGWKIPLNQQRRVSERLFSFLSRDLVGGNQIKMLARTAISDSYNEQRRDYLEGSSITYTVYNSELLQEEKEAEHQKRLQDKRKFKLKRNTS